MPLLRHESEIAFISSHRFLKKIMISVAVVSALAITGCASKPQISNSTRVMNSPDYYTVRSGDTLSGIAARYGLNYINIAQLNDIAPPYRIYVNQSLRLKGSAAKRTTTTQPITQAAPIQRQTIALPTTPSTTTQTASRPVTPAVAPVTTAPVITATPTSTSLRWVKPSAGPVIQQFNPATNVKGLRYGGNLGDPIYAAANGQVVYAADGLKEYGNLVLIKHIDGYITAYAHNSKMLVKSGDNVTAGQKIAEMGSSGTNRVMLEFQIRLDGKPINPANIIPMN
ncbi:MAG TPA: LysM peptidoglycan-binding domain-containing protein [Acinetobacter ursingii]|uniref:LysM peptidoglycan-binding domain-containing protein n=1 Tax=Acinetobacter ursingii TaxID=108980 RepID=A0A3D2SNE7_9GAMM|nr:peptidoglycan DD-metalloendopeptidase family protein [Acinetobacter ursingii]MCH2004865.1 peptidoglycan DD-metalloendopeptidase family protein [Acinetobacter ursingii]MCU4304378.1 peptidoglycan DD-metalloendopeptidase family protein [Acinetobacter ursingii]MCU4370383.1 peptidoglycan DD-metalloendopeptidase family protein [Acinetobacter ursingii]MCU4380368.1 peptidoglycan DD-metalloendopeptidase family protein [Acinetobacter ursingii]MCU4609629.1 peptidoglycan DD-metalloendopeptidase family 